MTLQSWFRCQCHACRIHAQFENGRWLEWTIVTPCASLQVDTSFIHHMVEMFFSNIDDVECSAKTSRLQQPKCMYDSILYFNDFHMPILSTKPIQLAFSCVPESNNIWCCLCDIPLKLMYCVRCWWKILGFRHLGNPTALESVWLCPSSHLAVLLVDSAWATWAGGSWKHQSQKTCGQ